MGRPSLHKKTIDLSNDVLNERLREVIKHCEGLYEVTLEATTEQRSLSQNALYWSQCVPELARHLMEQGDARNPKEAAEMAHGIFVVDCLGTVETVNPRTGELLVVRRETHTLRVHEFSIFYEKVCMWLARYLGHVVEERTPVTAGGRR